MVTICAMTVGACPLPISATQYEGESVEAEVSTEVSTSLQTDEIEEEVNQKEQENVTQTEEVIEIVEPAQTPESESQAEVEETEETVQTPESESLTEIEETAETEETTKMLTEEIALYADGASTTSVVELAIHDVSASVGELIYHYEGGDVASRYFTVEVSGLANAEIRAEELIEETITAGKELAGEISIMAVMEGPNGIYETVTGSVEVDDKLTVTISVSNTFEIRETGKYTFYIVVTDADNNTYLSDSCMKEITIPSEIGIVGENPVLNVSEAKRYPETGICTAFEIPCSVTFDISLTGLDGDVSVTQREQEIRDKLSQYKVYFNADNTSNIVVSLNVGEALVNQLMESKGAKVSHTESGIVWIKSAGEHKIYAKVNGIAAEAAEITIAKLTQSLVYQVEDNGGSPYKFQKDITCGLSEESLAVGTVTSAVMDTDRNEIAENEVMVISSGDNSYHVYASNPACNEEKTYTVTFSHSGNDIYECASTSIDLTFKRTKTTIEYTPEFMDATQQYQKEIVYTIPNHIDMSKVSCYETDANGTKVENGDLNISVKNNQVVLYHTNNDNQEMSVHTIVFEYAGDSVYTIDRQEKILEYSKLAQNIEFTSKPSYGTGTFLFLDKLLEFEILNGVGDATCYESNEKGERLSESADENLTITPKTGSANTFLVRTYNKKQVDEATFYMTFEYTGNQVYSSAKTIIPLHCVRKTNEIKYAASSDDIIHEYGEAVIFSHIKGETAGGISCYQSDKDGNRLDGRDDLVIEKGENGSYKVRGQRLSTAEEPFYVTIAHAEDDYYFASHQTFEFHVVKIRLGRNIDVQELEKGIFFKTRKMYVDVWVSAQHDNLTQEGLDAISFQLKAIQEEEDGVASMMQHTAPQVTYDDDKQAYRFRYQIDKDYAHTLKAGGKYEIEATTDYAVDYFEDFDIAYNSVLVQKSDISMTLDGSTSYNMEYSKDIKSISYHISGENFEEYPVGCSAQIQGKKIIEIVSMDNNSLQYKILKAGTARLILTADDTSKYDAHNEAVKEIEITVTSPSNTDYTINGKQPEDFLEEAVVVQSADGEEKWYEDDITFNFGGENLYTQICYSTNGKDNWVIKDIEEFVIGESMPTSYEYYFCDTEAEIYSKEVKPCMVLPNVGVDQTNPSWNPTLVINQKPSEHSDATISYFATGITVTGYAGSNLNSSKKVDAGSGIEKVFVQYGDSDIWDEIAFEDRYSNKYDLELSENKNYGSIKLKTVDYLGHESNVAEYQKIVCVDNVIPVVVAVNVDKNGKITDYDGTWTNQQLSYVVNLLQNPQVSGIYKYEWAFVLRGTGIQPEEITEWTEIDKNELGVVFGSAIGDSTNYAKRNGTLYFRAQSNAGLTTTKEDIVNQQKEIRIWQEDLEIAKVTDSIKPDTKTGWYNKKTGQVSISFEYPKYDEANCAPAIGIVYKLETKTSEDGEASSTTSKYFKGILAEKTSDGVVETIINDDLSKGTILINKDSINVLTVHVEDAAGNKSKALEYEYKADFVVPDIMSATAGGTDIKVHKDNATGVLFSKFSQNALSVEAETEYGISGKKNFYMAVTQEQGGKEALSNSNLRDSLNMEPCTRGFVYLCAVDGAGNQSEAWTDGIVVDNQAPTGGSQQEISVVTKDMNRAEFFNKDIEVSLHAADMPVSDHYSGLKSVVYTLGRDGQNTEGNITVFESQATSLTWDEIKKNHDFETQNIVIDAAKNESNHAYIEVTATDYAGNKSTITKELQIDITKPQIEISFEQNNALNEMYYNSDRVARIDIKELNFDPNQVEFVIYKDGIEVPAMIPDISSWNTTEENVHFTYIIFAEDGDYSFEVTCTDLAGNEAEKAVSENFTIDKTKPIVEVAYDNNDAWKENYYSQARTATITVTEHNFNAGDFEVVMNPQAALGSWTHDGDVHRVNIYFEQEQHYSYYINYIDLAGNSMDVFTEEDFYIDMNSPIIQIRGVEDHSANAGEVIPVVLVSDQNYDMNGVQIVLRNSKGQQITVAQTVTNLEGGYSYTLTNVNEQPDEIYTLAVLATDMSGNQSELTYRFSLNRNGSVYDLSQMSTLVEKAYLRYIDVEDLQIYEMNVDMVEEFNIIVTRNGKVVSSFERNARPQNGEKDGIYYATAVEGSDEIGYEYEYTIYRESFQQEGIYNIMFYSRDKAGNEVNNTLTEKQAEITFIVDNSAPTVVVEGVEPGELYTEETKDVNVYVSDNFKLQEAYFELMDEDGNILQTYNYMELAEEEGNIVTITLPSSNKRMSIQYYAIDTAGNDITTMPDEAVATSFMITTNAWIRYINNRKAVAGTVCAVVIIVIASAAGAFFIRRRKTI